MRAFEAENKKIKKIKSDLRNKFKKQGLTKDQINVKLIELNVNFLLHAYINGAMLKDEEIKDRLKLYIKTLNMFLKE